MDNKKRQHAQALLQQGELDDALVAFTELLQNNPKHPDLLHIIGIIHTHKKDLKKALTFVDKAIQHDNKNPAFYNTRGNVLTKLTHYKEAIQSYEKAIALKPSYANAFNNLGKCYYEQGKLDQAQKKYERALLLKPNHPDANYNYGILLAKLGDHHNAQKALQKTLEHNPGLAPAYSQLGQVYLHLGEYQEAAKHFEQRLALDPDNADVFYDLGIAYLNDQHSEKAIKAFEQALRFNTTHSDCNHYLATAYLHEGDPEKAINYFYRQLEIDALPESIYNIGVMLMHKERNQEACQYLERAAELDPAYLPTFLNLGALYLKRNRIEDAIRNYQAAANLKPDDPEIQHILAAISQEATPEAAPKEYLQHLFDQYATYYDKHLTECLHYTVPEKIYQTFFEETGITEPSLNILDLGCGTGLCACYFKPIAKQLIGVDLSEKMIDIARSKKRYDTLAVQDIRDALDQHTEQDLILAADVFTYIGDLDSTFQKVHTALKPGGYFIFSVESSATEPYVLQQSIRYAHSRRYLESLLAEHKFNTLRFDNLTLRQQKKQPVEGYLVLAERLSEQNE